MLFFLLSDRPQPPEGPVEFNEVYRNYMVISWKPPLDDGGCAVSNYIVEKRDTNRDLWMPVTSSCTRTTCKVGSTETLGEKMFREIHISDTRWFKVEKEEKCLLLYVTSSHIITKPLLLLQYFNYIKHQEYLYTNNTCVLLL